MKEFALGFAHTDCVCFSFCLLFPLLYIFANTKNTSYATINVLPHTHTHSNIPREAFEEKKNTRTHAKNRTNKQTKIQSKMSEKREKKEVKHVEQPENLSMLFAYDIPGHREKGTSVAPGTSEKRVYRKINTHTRAHTQRLNSQRRPRKLSGLWLIESISKRMNKRAQRKIKLLPSKFTCCFRFNSIRNCVSCTKTHSYCIVNFILHSHSKSTCSFSSSLSSHIHLLFLVFANVQRMAHQQNPQQKIFSSCFFLAPLIYS